MKEKKRHIENPDFNDVIERSQERFLILHNDDVNTFDFVIETLMEVCEHDLVQAEQCTFIVHYKGKCDVKKGGINMLSSLKNKLIKKGLTATID